MEELLEITVLTALMAAFAILLMKKWGITEWVQVHGDAVMSRLFACDLCLSFWVSVIITVIALCFVDDARVMMVPVLSTPVTRMLV